MRGRRETGSEEEEGERKWMERNEGGGLRGRRERGSEEEGEEGWREVVMRRAGGEKRKKEKER